MRSSEVYYNIFFRYSRRSRAYGDIGEGGFAGFFVAVGKILVVLPVRAARDREARNTV